MQTSSHRSGTFQALGNSHTPAQIPIVQPPLVVKANHDIPKAHVSVEQTGIYKCGLARYIVQYISKEIKSGPSVF